MGISSEGSGNNNFTINPQQWGNEIYHAKIITRQKMQVLFCVLAFIASTINCIGIAYMLANQISIYHELQIVSKLTTDHILSAQQRVDQLKGIWGKR